MLNQHNVMKQKLMREIIQLTTFYGRASISNAHIRAQNHKVSRIYAHIRPENMKYLESMYLSFSELEVIL